MSTPLERAIARFRRPEAAPRGPVAGRISAAAFRAAVEQRLLNLEREMSELKTRLNGLIFLVVGTVISQLVARLMG